MLSKADIAVLAVAIPVLVGGWLFATAISMYILGTVWTSALLVGAVAIFVLLWLPSRQRRLRD